MILFKGKIQNSKFINPVVIFLTFNLTINFYLFLTSDKK